MFFSCLRWAWFVVLYGALEDYRPKGYRGASHEDWQSCMISETVQFSISSKADDEQCTDVF